MTLRTPTDDTAMPDPTWNETAVDYPPVTLHEAFAAQVRRTPHAPAISFRKQRLSYRELEARTDALAATLVSRGAGRGTLVAVCMERSIEMVVALYSILKAGSAYVPIDPEYPDDRIGFMLGDAKAPILLTQSHLAGRLEGAAAQVIAIDEPASSTASGSVPGSLPRVELDDLAYVIYTSGSTGRPKGAMISHRAIVNRLFWMQDAFGLTPADRILQKTPFSFDVSVWEFFWPLLFGAELVVAEPEGHRDSAYLVRTIVERAITTIHFVPSMLQLFLEDPRAGDCTSLVRVICSGEALPRALQDRFFERLDAELHNLYGPTEAAVDVSAWACDPDSDLPFVPIGRPIANTQLHIVDEHMQPVPVGTAGELCIGGVQVAHGYLDRPQLTAERFVDDPFRDGGKLYRTGDLARYLPEGDIEFLGRSDFQVKIRGLRVELGEIEATLESMPGVRGAVVVAHERADGDLELIAYVAHPDGEALPVDDLRGRLATSLPDYMIPATFIGLERFELTSNGKVDRKALPKPERVRPSLDAAFVAPRSRLERLIADKWQRILDLDRVGVHDRFFELGGTSLQAARFVNQMQTELGESIFVVTLFSAPSVAEYAALLERQYPAAVSRVIGDGTAPVQSVSRAPMTEADLDRLSHAVPTLGDRIIESDTEPNPSAIFILSPPRSGTTLLRIMLAGHRDLFAASELQLLHFRTLAERAAAYSGPFSAWLDGTVRTLMEIDGLDADAARAAMHAAETDGLTTKRFFGQLQEAVAPRILVDKSPSYALDPAALRKAEAEFTDARYIHLVRQPLAMIDSFERHHMEQVLYLDDHPFDSRGLAELIWTLSHRNTVEFLAGIPSDRWVRMRFEDLVRQPEAEMRTACDALGLEYDPAVARPYEYLEHKMIDGVYAESAPMGDPGFLAHGRIDVSAAEVGDAAITAPALGEATLALAEELGYRRSEDGARDPRSDRRALARQRSRRRAARGSSDG